MYMPLRHDCLTQTGLKAQHASRQAQPAQAVVWQNIDHVHIFISLPAPAQSSEKKSMSYRSIAVTKYTVRYTPLLNTSSSCKLPSHLHPKTWRQCYISLFIGSISLNYNSKLLDKFKGTSMYPLRWALVCLCFHTHWIMLIHQLFWSVDVVMMDQKSLNIIVPVPCVTTAFVRNVSRYVWYFAEEIETNNPSLRY